MKMNNEFTEAEVMAAQIAALKKKIIDLQNELKMWEELYMSDNENISAQQLGYDYHPALGMQQKAHIAKLENYPAAQRIAKFEAAIQEHKLDTGDYWTSIDRELWSVLESGDE
jgi:uncharacterized protein YllA (UPF0747 family)